MRDDSWKPRASQAMERWADGDERAFDLLYSLVEPRLRAFLLRRTHDAARTDDLVNETFLRMFKSRAHFATGACVMTWAFTIARRLFIDEHRKAREALEPDAASVECPSNPEMSPDSILGRHRLGRRIAELLKRIPEDHAEAFNLVQVDGLKLAEAAVVIGVTETAVKLRVHRAYKALREELGDEVREELEIVT